LGLVPLRCSAIQYRQPLLYKAHVSRHAPPTTPLNASAYALQGKSRSSAVVVAYLLALRQFDSVGAALAFVQTRRAMAQPNPGFMALLEGMHTRGILNGLLPDQLG